ncbi:hypothetical protein BKA93DRAFT_747447 [Sparassis latifolia]
MTLVRATETSTFPEYRQRAYKRTKPKHVSHPNYGPLGGQSKSPSTARPAEPSTFEPRSSGRTRQRAPGSLSHFSDDALSPASALRSSGGADPPLGQGRSSALRFPEMRFRYADNATRRVSREIAGVRSSKWRGVTGPRERAVLPGEVGRLSVKSHTREAGRLHEAGIAVAIVLLHTKECPKTALSTSNCRLSLSGTRIAVASTCARTCESSLNRPQNVPWNLGTRFENSPLSGTWMFHGRRETSVATGEAEKIGSQDRMVNMTPEAAVVARETHGKTGLHGHAQRPTF